MTPPEPSIQRAARDRLDRQMAALAAAGITRPIYAVPLLPQSRRLPSSATEGGTSFFLRGSIPLDQPARRLEVTVFQNILDPSGKVCPGLISDEEMRARVPTENALLRLGGITLAESWREVPLRPRLAASGRVLRYEGHLDLRVTSLQVVLHPALASSQGYWLCTLERETTGAKADNTARNRAQ